MPAVHVDTHELMCMCGNAQNHVSPALARTQQRRWQPADRPCQLAAADSLDEVGASTSFAGFWVTAFSVLATTDERSVGVRFGG